MHLYALDAILVSCMSESLDCINSINQVITLISWNQRFMSLTQGCVNTVGNRQISEEIHLNMWEVFLLEMVFG